MKIETLEVAGIKQALHGMRNPMDSWGKSDSHGGLLSMDEYVIGENDMGLCKRLIKGGNEHSKYLRMIQVWADFYMPRYWWSEFDTYKIGTTANSCSTMHRLLNNQKPITIELFTTCEEDIDIMMLIICKLEAMRQEYLQTKDSKLLVRAKRLLPEGFLQMRTVNLNYATIRNIYHQRKHHRLKEEWVDTFCSWVESLPYAEELIIE